MLTFFAGPASAGEPQPSPNLPRYDINLRIDTTTHRAELIERVTWTNPTRTPTTQLAFNFYPHYQVPQGDYLLLSKTLELLRLQPSLGIDRSGRHGVVNGARLVVGTSGPLEQPRPLSFEFAPDNPTALRFMLPHPVAPGESVTVELNCTYHLPNKQGRWGHYEGVTYLTNSLPLLAYYDDSGWRPMPFVPWHQPWFNEAGVFRATIELPEAETLVTPAVTKSQTIVSPGWKRVETQPFLGRDFAIVCSARYREFRSQTQLPDGQSVALRCFAFPEHEFYAMQFLRIVAEAIPVFSRWFGPYPYSQFTITESYFGWNGNECAGLIMIDERVFAMPHLLRNYADYLVSHETCHQWWYNLVGTNGYSEPFVDEGAAAYFTHRLLDQKMGKNNPFIAWPNGCKWLPNIKRENYRWSGMINAIRNDQMQPAAQDLPKYGHLFGLFTGAYDRGMKVYGMIEERLGETAFLDFIQGIVSKYGWRVLQVADLRRELEAYTGRDWGEFFDNWVYGKATTDWAVESVTVDHSVPLVYRWIPLSGPVGENRTTVVVRQRGKLNEPTTLGVRLAGQGGFPIRVPIVPGAGPTRITLPQAAGGGSRDLDVTIEPGGDGTVRVSFSGFANPEQVEIDPDNVLLDSDRGNNRWKNPPSFRVTPLYTMLDEADLTSDYDRCNFTAGPWVWGATYPDPWYTRSTMLGLRAGVNRPQKFNAGAYAAIRSDYRDAVFGVDAALMEEMQQTWVNWEYRIGGPWGGQAGASAPQRAALYHRWILKQTSSLYLPPMVYHETFAAYQDNFLPFARTTTPGAERWDRSMMWGWHFRANLYTPYWDPECGYWVDLMAGVGAVRLPGWRETGQLRVDLAGVQQLPDWLGPLRLARVAGRVVAMGALPDKGQFFALGGGTLFRGYDLAQRQGSAMWVGNLELRVPIVRNVEWDCLDHCVGVRNVWTVAFYDVGDVYANGRSVGGRVAHAVGGGLRVDMAVFSFIERATLRLDAAKVLNDSTGWQAWFGISQAF